jgi:hypothetical protein
VTWFENTSIHSEFFQPIGVPNSKTFFAISEACLPNPSNASKVMRSDDGGKTWINLYQYPTSGNDVITGMIQVGRDMKLFFQTSNYGSEGIMMSDDSGKTFTSICGPTNSEDTRFYVQDTLIYAGDKYGGLWLNTTGIGSNSMPILSKPQVEITAKNCRLIEDTLTFTFFDSCNGRQATLLDASVTGSSRFQPITGQIPRTIQPDDTIRISYLPDTNSTSTDSALLHLRFTLGWKEFDTVVTVIGHGYDAKKFIASSFIPDTSRVSSVNCDSLKTPVHFTVIDTCQSDYARLVNAGITGSSAFTIKENLPRTTTANDSVIVSYHPSIIGGDTSSLRLHYEIEGVSFDTIITLIGSYQPPKLALTPKFSDTSLSLFASACNPGNVTLYFSFYDSCTSQSGTLLSALPGTNDFTVGGSFPRPTSGNDSLKISFDGSSGGTRTNLDLHFRIGSYDYDTTITLLGTGSNTKETVGFSLAGSPTFGRPGSTTDVNISPTNTIANKGLNEISFDLTYNGDVLGMPQASTGRTGLSVTQGAETRIGKFATLPVTIKGTNMTLDSGQTFASVQFFVYLSDSTTTPMQLANVRLNKTDPDYERCTLSATADTTNILVNLYCEDTIVVEYLRGHNLPLRIVSLKPNPAQNEVAVELDAAEGGVAMMEIYDELGKRVMRKEIAIAKGKQKVTISTADIAEGMYSVRLGNVSGRFVKVK